MEIGQLSGEHGLKNSPACDAQSVSSSLREVAKLAAAKEAAVTKSSSFGLIALQDKLSFHHWSMIDATPAEIKLLVADVVAYKWNVAARMIARFWRRYIFLTRAKTLFVTSASTQLQADNSQLKRQHTQHSHLTSMSARSPADVPEFKQAPVPQGRSSCPMVRNPLGGTVASQGGQAPDSATECSASVNTVNWV